MRSIFTRVLLALLLFPVGASAQTSVWSATMTVGVYDTPEVTYVGYHPGVEIGSIDDDLESSSSARFTRSTRSSKFSLAAKYQRMTSGRSGCSSTQACSLTLTWRR